MYSAIINGKFFISICMFLISISCGNTIMRTSHSRNEIQKSRSAKIICIEKPKLHYIYSDKFGKYVAIVKYLEKSSDLHKFLKGLCCDMKKKFCRKKYFNRIAFFDKYEIVIIPEYDIKNVEDKYFFKNKEKNLFTQLAETEVNITESEISNYQEIGIQGEFKDDSNDVQYKIFIPIIEISGVNNLLVRNKIINKIQNAIKIKSKQFKR